MPGDDHGSCASRLSHTSCECGDAEAMRLRQYASRALSPQQAYGLQQAMTVEHPQQETLPGNAQSFSQSLDGIGDKLQCRDHSDEVETLIRERECERITQQIVRAIAQACLFEHGGRCIQSGDVETLFREPAGKMTSPTSNLKQAARAGEPLQLLVEQRLLLLHGPASEPLLIPGFVVACNALIEFRGGRVICSHLLSPPLQATMTSGQI